MKRRRSRRLRGEVEAEVVEQVDKEQKGWKPSRQTGKVSMRLFVVVVVVVVFLRKIAC